MKHLFTTLCLFLVTINCVAQDTLELSDLELLNNVSWTGKLTYKDYQSGKLTSIDATMQTKIEGNEIVYSIQYIYEPNKNNTSSVKIKKNGTYYGNEKVVSNTFNNGIRTFVTTYKGKDNGKKATMFITHQFSNSTYKETKEVLLEGSEERFVRNSYEFTIL